jgi:hypothetical protein
VAKFWLSDKFKCLNVLTTAVLWAIWKSHSDLCFQNMQWTGMKVVARPCARMLRDWKIIQKQEEADKLEFWSGELERIGAREPRLSWRVSQNQDQAPGLGCASRSCVVKIGGYDACVSVSDAVNNVEPKVVSSLDAARCAGLGCLQPITHTTTDTRYRSRR